MNLWRESDAKCFAQANTIFNAQNIYLELPFRETRKAIKVTQPSRLQSYLLLLTGILLFLSVNSAHAAQINWLSNVDGNWHSAENWSGGLIPASTDDVSISGGHTVTISSDVAQALTLSLDGNLVITGGEFRTTGQALISGSLTVTNNATLKAEGALASIDVTQSALISRGNVLALNGARITLPGASNLLGAGLLRAQGAGSKLELANISNIGVGLPGPLVVKHAFGRELSLFNNGTSVDDSTSIAFAVSREFSVYQADSETPTGGNSLAIAEAFTREYSIFQSSEVDPAGSGAIISEVTSREFSLFMSDVENEALTEIKSISSRENSIEHLPDPLASTD